MRIQRGTVYMNAIDKEVMGAVPNRIWWKPWRWQVELLPWNMRDVRRVGVKVWGWEVSITEKLIIRNLTKEGAIGVMKLYGIKHKDFEEE